MKELQSKRWKGKAKIITGIRRCGKSFLLSSLYKDYLKEEGVEEDCFVELTHVKDSKKRQSQYEVNFVVYTGKENLYPVRL